jgi:DNA polymerase-1
MNEYYVIEDISMAERLLAQLLARRPSAISIDIETTSRNEYRGQILGIGISWKVHTGIYIPLMVRDLGLMVSDLRPRWTAEQNERLIDLLRQVMTCSAMIKIAHNAEFEIKWIGHHWQTELVNTFCTFWYRFIRYPDTSKGYERRLGLDHIVHEKYPDLSYLKSIWQGIREDEHGDKDLSLYRTTQQIGEYCCGDCDVALREYHADLEDMRGKPYAPLWHTRYMPEIHFVARMVHNGFPVDIDYLQRTRERLRAQQSGLLEQIREGAHNKQFNPNAESYLEQLLIKSLRLPPVENQVYDQRSKRTVVKHVFDEPVLSAYAEQHGCDIARDILEYRRLTKLISTYFDGVESKINPVTGRVHSDIKAHGTETLRWSSSEPNLQNLPTLKASSRIVKQMFVAPEGYVLVGADYSQMELRLIAYLSQDPMMLKAYRENLDLHRLTASGIFGIPFDQVTGFQRKIGKPANFALCYLGAAGVLVWGPKGIGNEIMGPEYAERLGIPFDQIKKVKIDKQVLLARAQEIRRKYMEMYAGLLPWTQRVIKRARADGYVVSEYGSIRYLPEINSADDRQREHAERQAVNFNPQSTGSLYQTFHFMDEIAEFDRRSWGVEPALAVHDQQVMFVPEDKVDLVMHEIPDLGTREDEAHITIPMLLEPSSGHSLDQV